MPWGGNLFRRRPSGRLRDAVAGDELVRVMSIGGAAVSVTVQRSCRRRCSVAFALESPSRLKVAAPQRMSFDAIEVVVRRHECWLARQIALLRAAPQLYISAQRLFVEGEIVPYLGFSLRLHIVHDASKRRGCVVAPRRLIVNLQSEAEYSSPRERHEAARLEVLLWFKRRARQKLKRRLDVWAGRMGAQYGGMAVGSAGRRWGSCTSGNDIRLNWRLIMAPLPLLDYVVVHELAHVFHKNHSERFWALVAQFLPDYKARRAQLHAIGDRLAL